jgi:microcin C transport system substrate-binding protein
MSALNWSLINKRTGRRGPRNGRVQLRHDLGAWSGSLFKDPESCGASREADRPGGNNITGFKNAEVDALIERQRAIFDIEQRNEICRAIDAIATREWCPISALEYQLCPSCCTGTSSARRRRCYRSSATNARPTACVWYDEDSAADLADAQARDARLPRAPAMVQFDEVFGK